MKSKIFIRIKADDTSRNRMAFDGLYADVIGEIAGKEFRVDNLVDGVALITIGGGFFRRGTTWHISADCYRVL